MIDVELAVITDPNFEPPGVYDVILSPLPNLAIKSPDFGVSPESPSKGTVKVVVEFDDICVFTVNDVQGSVNPDALKRSSLNVLIISVWVNTFAVFTMVCTLAAPPVPPVPSLINETVSPTV